MHTPYSFVTETGDRLTDDALVRICLREFFKENQLAHDVAQDKTKYMHEVQFILDRYDTFWRRVLPPAVDEEFDTRTRDVLNSMNSVGVARVNPETYTAESRRARIYRNLALEGGTGIVCSGILGVGAYVSHLSVSLLFIPLLSLLGWKDVRDKQ